MTRTTARAAIIALLSLSAAGALIARSRGSTTVIDRSFLTALSLIPVGRSLTEDETDRYGTLYWTNELEFQYLARKHDPVAERIAVRILSNQSVPGGCCCDFGRFPSAIFDRGIGPAFWPAIVELPLPQRASVLRTMDSVDYGEDQADVPWMDERDRHLAADPALKQIYDALVSAETADNAAGE
jgi:hypothetical protein